MRVINSRNCGFCGDRDSGCNYDSFTFHNFLRDEEEEKGEEKENRKNENDQQSGTPQNQWLVWQHRMALMIAWEPFIFYNWYVFKHSNKTIDFGGRIRIGSICYHFPSHHESASQVLKGDFSYNQAPSSNLKRWAIILLHQWITNQIDGQQSRTVNSA